jgi:hypothetical protein
LDGLMLNRTPHVRLYNEEASGKSAARFISWL